VKVNWLDRALLSVAPEKALRRARARHMATAFYEAGQPSKNHKSRRGNASHDTNVARAADYVREQSRYLEQNYDVAESVLQTFVRFVVGQEVLFEPQVMSVSGGLHEEFNQELVHWFKLWARCPEVTCEYTYHEGVRQHIRSKLRDGEIFQQYLEGFIPGLQHGTALPLSLEHIEADFFPMGYSDPAKGIVQSVEKNAWGRPRRYWAYKHHPGESIAARFRPNGQPDKAIDAANMVHDKVTTHFRQTRGMPIFANVLSRFDDIKDIEESERVAARCAAAMVGFRKRGTPDDWDEDDEDESTELSFEPGMFHDLEPGEDVDIHQSNRPNNALIPFLEQQFKRIAGGTGASFSSIAREYNGTFSSQRQELVESFVGYGVMHADLSSAKLAPDWRRLVATLVKYKLIIVPPDVDPRTLYDVDIPRPPMPWIDPQKEANASKILVENDLESRTHVMRSRGRNPNIVMAQIQGDPFRSAQQATRPALADSTETVDPEEDYDET